MENRKGESNPEEIRFYDIRVPEVLPDFPSIAEARAAAHRQVDEKYDNWMMAAWVNNEIAMLQEASGEFVPLDEVLQKVEEK